jgi:small subunit ribosomal protein S6
MVLFDAGVEEEAIRASVDRAVELVRSRGGDPSRVDHWGRRRFAYELKHRWEGYYVLLTAQAEPAVMAELDRMLFLADEVLRHKVIRLPEGVTPQSRPAAAAPAAEEPAAVVAGPGENGASE